MKLKKGLIKQTVPALVLVILLSGCKNTGASPEDLTGDATPIGKTNVEASDFFASSSSTPTPEAPPMEEEPQEYYTADPEIGSNTDMLPVSKALAAKMISLAIYDKALISTLDREITFPDTDPGKWYDQYINAACLSKVMTGGSDSFDPEKSLTVSQAQIILDRFNPDNKISIKITDENKNEPISYSLWVDLFNRVLAAKAGDKTIESEFGLVEKSFIVLATPANNSKLSAWSMVTDKGAYTFAGINMDSYIDKQIRVQVKSSEVVSVLEVESTVPTVLNGYITQTTPQSISIFSGGAERTYSYENTLTDAVGKIADISISGTVATNVQILDETVLTGTIKRVSSSSLELAELGERSMSDNIKIYSATGGIQSPKWRGIRDLTVGSDIAEFIVSDGEVCAAIIKKSPSVSKIRVALTTDGSSKLLHESVSFTVNGSFKVFTYDDTGKTYQSGEVVTIDNSTVFPKDYPRFYVVPEDSASVITLLSVTRQGKNPSYRGTLEICRHSQEGMYSVVSELPIEQYLYSVVPSEMPTAHGKEAAKVQAVTARSYAYNQFFANRYCQYGGNVDDTTQSQVYNNVAETSTAIEAVTATAGQCLTYNGSVISANFYSTSAGVGADSGDVWANSENKAFPSNTPVYLSSTKQYEGRDFGDLQIEKNADEFLRATDIDAYDKNFNWFRWKVTMTVEELSAVINAAIASRQKASPHFVRLLTDGQFLIRPISSVGILKDIKVVKRGVGGNIMEMIITGSEATVKVATEYNVRCLIAPKQLIDGKPAISLTRADGSSVSNFSLMPSAFFTFDKNFGENGELESFTFYGGGYGHGVGMSQNGVKGMVDRGYSYEDILSAYYPETKIEKKY